MRRGLGRLLIERMHALASTIYVTAPSLAPRVGASCPSTRAATSTVNLRPHHPTRRILRTHSTDADATTETETETPTTPKPKPSRAHQGPSVKRTTFGGESRTSSDASDKEFHGNRARRVSRYVRPALPPSDDDDDASAASAASSSRFPYEHDTFCFDGLDASLEDLTRAFTPVISPDRLARLDAVVEQRSFDILPILEGAYDIGNVLAVCRSTEALGIGTLGVVSDTGLKFKQGRRTSGGAVKWTHLQQWRSTADAVRDAKKRGYRVLTTVFEGGHPLEHYDWTVPTAVILGNEREGVSEEAKKLADGGVYVSMNGFTESLNVSVASSLVMHHAVQDRTRRAGKHGSLTEREKETLRGVYLARLVPNYARQGYLRQLIERAGKLGEAAACGEGGGDDEPRDAETDDEVILLNALEVAKIVKRPRRKKWGRPVKDDHARILSEVELAPERESESG